MANHDFTHGGGPNASAKSAACPACRASRNAVVTRSLRARLAKAVAS